jgi:8-oxo-dGTP diphosphatase
MTSLVVAAAVVERDGRFLVTRRQKGVHLEGLWEFPGGKCEAGEMIVTCLRREIREELDTEIVVAEEIFTTTHAYPDRRVELHFMRCTLVGEPVPQIGQEVRWAWRHELGALEFPPADSELIRLLTQV